MAKREYTAEELPRYKDLLDRDPRKAPDTYYFENRVDHGVADLALEHYTSRERHRLEVERMWKRVWQLAGFEIDLPTVGSYITYEIAGISIILTRSSEDGYSAFYNSCRHRAAALTRTESGRAQRFVCPYHGWTYQLDGVLSHLPSQWDFPHVCPGKDRIQAVRVETFKGMIFINLDPSAPSLEAYLGAFVAHSDPYPSFADNKRVRTAWVRKIVPVNWKAAQEAFMEGYHLPTTHAQLAPGAPGYEMGYAVLGDHATRVTSAVAAPNWMSGPGISEQDILDKTTSPTGMPRIVLKEGQTARAGLAEFLRSTFLQMTGLDLSHVSDSEVVDSPLNYIFPNIVVWGGYAVPWVYRFRPNGDDPLSAIMEVFQMTPVGPAAAAQATHAAVRELGPEDPFAQAVELGYLGPVLDQDFNNMQMQQLGFRSSPDGLMRLSRYQESLIRQHHSVMNRYLS